MSRAGGPSLGTQRAEIPPRSVRAERRSPGPLACLLAASALACGPDPSPWSVARSVEIQSTDGPWGGTVTALRADRGRLLAGTSIGRALRSDDRGETWSPLPPMPAGPGGLADPIDDLVLAGEVAWIVTSSATWRWGDGSWERVRDGAFDAPSRVWSDGGDVFVVSDDQPVFRHTPGGALRRLDALGPVRAFALDGRRAVARRAGPDCEVVGSDDGGETWAPLPPPPACPALLSVAAERVWGHGGEPPISFALEDGVWRLAPIAGAVVALAGDGCALTADGRVWFEGAVGIDAPRPDPLVVAADERDVWIGVRGEGVFRRDGGAWRAGTDGLVGHRVDALLVDGDRLLAGVEGGVHAWRAGWQPPLMAPRPDVRPVGLAPDRTDVVALTESDGPFLIGAGWTPAGARWPVVAGRPVAGAGIAALPGGALVAGTRPAPELARVLRLADGAWVDLTQPADLRATDPVRPFPTFDGALLASVRGWRITSDGGSFQQVGPGVFDPPPHPLVLDAASDRDDTWLVLFDPFDETEPCERCAPARRAGPGFPIVRDGLPAEVRPAGIALVDGVALMTVAAPDPSLWRHGSAGWERIASLPVTPSGALVALDGALLTDTRDGGIYRLTPR
jgi:hypothetical protein